MRTYVRTYVILAGTAAKKYIQFWEQYLPRVHSKFCTRILRNGETAGNRRNRRPAKNCRACAFFRAFHRKPTSATSAQGRIFQKMSLQKSFPHARKFALASFAWKNRTLFGATKFAESVRGPTSTTRDSCIKYRPSDDRNNQAISCPIVALRVASSFWSETFPAQRTLCRFSSSIRFNFGKLPIDNGAVLI